MASSPQSPEIERINQRNEIWRQRLVSKPAARKVAKKEKPQDEMQRESIKFQKEVEQGKYQPTPEAVEKLMLVPRFDSIKLHDFGGVKSRNGMREKQEKRRIPAGITPEEYEQIREKAKERATNIYTSAFNLSAKETASINDQDRSMLRTTSELIMRDESYDLLKIAVKELSREVHRIEEQNKILQSHLQLLGKAHENLSCVASCSIQAIQWERQMIEKYYAENPTVKRRIPKMKKKDLINIIMKSSERALKDHPAASNRK